jgi:hypothetical protein
MQDSFRRERFAFRALNDRTVGGRIAHGQAELVLAFSALPVKGRNPVGRVGPHLIQQKSHGRDGQNGPGE